MHTMDQFRLDGRVAVVTGGGEGLGKAMAIALAEAGANIAIADIRMETARETEKYIQSLGVEAMVHNTDVTKEDQTKELVQQVEKKFGRIDILVNNAGITHLEPIESLSFENWSRVLDVNLNGVFLMSKAVGTVMLRQKRGSIINISSMSGLIVNNPQHQTVYNVSKAGVIMFTKSLASEWASSGIRVNTIAPGYMQTKLTEPYFQSNGDMVQRWMSLTPMGRPGMPSELGGITVYLASDASSYATGGVFAIDGGYTVW